MKDESGWNLGGTADHAPSADSVSGLGKQAEGVPNLLRVLAEHWVLVIAVAYILGFIVVNAHLAEYHIPEVELIRARYLAAALLLVAVSVIPALAGAWITQDVLLSGDHWLRKAAIGLVITLIGYTLWWQPIQMLAVPHGFAWNWRAMLYFGTVVSLVVATPMIVPAAGGRKEHKTVTQRTRTVSKPLAAVPLAVGWVAAVTLFGTMVYPYLKPGLGGGGVSLGSLYLDPALQSDSVLKKLSFPVAVVDRDDKLLKLVACSSSGGKDTTVLRLEIPRDKVLRLRVDGTSTAPDYINSCRRRRTPRPPPRSEPASTALPATAPGSQRESLDTSSKRR